MARHLVVFVARMVGVGAIAYGAWDLSTTHYIAVMVGTLLYGLRTPQSEVW